MCAAKQEAAVLPRWRPRTRLCSAGAAGARGEHLVQVQLNGAVCSTGAGWCGLGELGECGRIEWLAA